MKHCITAHTLDLEFILHFLSSYTCEQRIILVRDLEFEYEYKLVDMVLERPESPLRSCTLAMLIEPIELYARDFHDLLANKQLNRIQTDISRKLVEILLTLNNEDTNKFKENYETLFESTVENDVDIVFGKENLIEKLIVQMLEGKRSEDSGHSMTVAKTIAKKLYEASEDRPAIDYDTFIKIFTRDAFSQLSAIFDMYEDKYGRPIQEAIQREFQGQIEIDCFHDLIEFTRSPPVYYAKALRQAFNENPIDYVTLIRTIVGHQEKDLDEITLEYSKVFDETLENTIKNRVEVFEIKRLLYLIVTHGHDLGASEYAQVLFEHANHNHHHHPHLHSSAASNSANSSGVTPPSSTTASTTSLNHASGGMRRNRSQEAFDKLVSVFKTMRPH